MVTLDKKTEKMLDENLKAFIESKKKESKKED